MPQNKFAFQRDLVSRAISQRLAGVPIQQGFSKFHLKEKYQKPINMKKYLGVKIVEAEPAWKTFHQIDGTNIYPKSTNPESWNGCEDGYKVVYEDGYVSWSPKDVFEKAYKEVGVVADEKEERAMLVNPSTGNWHVVGSVATMEVPKRTNASEFFPFGTAIEELKVGKKVARTGWNGKGMFLFYISENMNSQIGGWTFTNGRCDNYELCPFIAMKTADEKVVPWLASQTDMLAEDWQIVE